MSSKLQIGSITAGYRPIKNGDHYNRYFPKPGNEDRIIIEDGEVDDTVDLMKRVVWKYLDDTKQIAPVLKGNTAQQTCQNIWNFLYHHIQYQLDKQGLEQLRRPARSWSERKTGIDCDCFSIFCSSILTNLQIPHSFRITKYDGPQFQHVYVVVPDSGDEIIIDAVLSKFDYEKPYSTKKDFTMNLSGIDVAVLSGIDGDLEQVLFGLDLGDNLGSASSEDQLQAIYNYLISTRNTIAKHPEYIQHSEDPEAFLKMLDYALEYWHTDKRDEALSILAMNEIDLNNKMGLNGELGSLKSFFNKVGNTVKSAAKKVGSAVKTAAKAVVKYNPLTATARGGLLLAMKLNLKGMASKLKWAYGTQAQAARHGISAAQYNNTKRALQKIEVLFADKLQGGRSNLKDAILKGKAGGLNGFIQPLGELGEPISMTAAIAAATPVIIATVKIMKDAGLFDKNEDTSTNNLVNEAKAANGSASPSPSVAVNPNNSIAINPNYNPGGNNYDAGAYMLPTDAGIDPSGGSQGGSFIKNNPMVLVAGVGVVGVAAYFLLRPKKKPVRRSSLSGVKSNRRRSKTGSRSKTRGSRIPRVTIK